MRPKLPTAASLAAAAAAAAEQASQQLLERALPKQASTASLTTVAKTETSRETDPPAATESRSGAAPSSEALATALGAAPAVTVPDSMDTDIAPVAPALDSEAEPQHAEPDKAKEAVQNAELIKQTAAELPASDLERSVLMHLGVLCLFLSHGSDFGCTDLL